MDFHQKTLLSDEFGIGMAGLLMENFFGAGSFVDISIALNDPAAYQDIEQDGDAQPDYLMWGDEPIRRTTWSNAKAHRRARP